MITAVSDQEFNTTSGLMLLPFFFLTIRSCLLIGKVAS